MLAAGWVTELLSWCRVTCAELLADFPALCQFCLWVVLAQHTFHCGELFLELLCSQGWFMFFPLASPALECIRHKCQSWTPHAKRCCKGGVCSLQPVIPTLRFLGELQCPARPQGRCFSTPSHPICDPSCCGTSTCASIIPGSPVLARGNVGCCCTVSLL